MYGIHEDHRIDLLQGAFLPFFYDGKVLVCDTADGAVRNINIVQISHMAFYVTGGHSLRIHGNDLILHILGDGILVFFDDLRFKFNVTVSGNIDFHISITGMHRFTGMAVRLLWVSLFL